MMRRGVRLTAACGCGRDDRNGSSVDGFQAPGLMTTSMRFVGHGKAVPAVLMSRQLSFLCPPVVPGQLRHSPDQVPGRGLEQHQSRTVVRRHLLTLNDRPREVEPEQSSQTRVGCFRIGNITRHRLPRLSTWGGGATISGDVLNGSRTPIRALVGFADVMLVYPRVPPVLGVSPFRRGLARARRRWRGGRVVGC